MVGNGLLSFPKVVGICHCLRSIHFDCALPYTNPRFCYWEIHRGYVGIVHPCFPGRWGYVIFKNANPHLPPPQRVSVVVGHCIDRCITVSELNQSWCVSSLLMGDYYCGLRKFSLSFIWSLWTKTHFWD